MKGGKRPLVCLAASAGGHLSQMLRLEPAWGEYEHFFVTTGEMVKGELVKRFGAPVYVVVEANREHPFKIARMLIECAMIIISNRPDVVLSTGAAPGCLLAIVGKALGAKVVWVDSIANVKRVSLSGRIVRPIADVFLTQWADLADEGKGIEYAGELA